MKAKKIVIGAVSAAMLSLSVCSLAPVFAAGETVQISVGKAEVKAGETFSVDVSLKNIPSSGIQCCDFAVKYDSSLISIDSVKAGALANTAAVKDDPSASMLSIFDSSIDKDKGTVTLVWSTSLEDSSYWMNGDGVFCTINGTVSKDAPDGTLPLEIVPTSRDTFTGSNVENDVISVGYFNKKEVVRYAVNTSNGSVTIGAGGQTTSVKYGDANCDGNVNISDAVLIMQSISNPEEFKVSAQGKLNGDVVDNGGGLTNIDALAIQYVEIKTITPDAFPMTSADLDALAS
ncbi:MAG: Cohesin domain protein [Ruminococcus sp.]|nr:Cohesin domain protein [Ruminococcus sp.]